MRSTALRMVRSLGINLNAIQAAIDYPAVILTKVIYYCYEIIFLAMT